VRPSKFLRSDRVAPAIGVGCDPGPLARPSESRPPRIWNRLVCGVVAIKEIWIRQGVWFC
jgi:hypothetical protein